jgi:hypothetical protein
MLTEQVMTHILSRSVRAVSRLAITAAAVAAIGIPATASAQLSGLVKKARDKVVENKVEKQIEKRTPDRGAAPKFDDVTVELSAERLTQMIRGLTAGRAALAGRETLVTRRDAAMQQSGELSDKNNKLISTYTDKRYENERCRNDAMNASRDKRQAVADKETKEWQAKAMSDPAFREKAVAIAQKAGEAQARGDTAAVRKIMAEMGVKADDPKPDTIAADKACGRPPAKPPVLVQIDSLDGIAKELSEQIRKKEEKASATEVTESGLSDRQFFMARERIEAYLSSVKYKSKPSGFSAVELQALGARKADLEKVM